MPSSIFIRLQNIKEMTEITHYVLPYLADLTEAPLGGRSEDPPLGLPLGTPGVL